MKINIQLEELDTLWKELANVGIEHDENSEYTLSKKRYIKNYIAVTRDGAGFYIPIDEIFYIESMGHDILVHTKDRIYNSGERLKQFESELDSDRFMRISNSCIVAIKSIKHIEVSVFQKFILHLTNGEKQYVTRSYYYLFKEKMGI